MIDVIIPTKDRVGYLRKALNSVLQQSLESGTRVKAVVVDDESAPPLKAQIKFLKNVEVVENRAQDHGPAVARNIGKKRCYSEYVAFLDSDDYWDRSFLSRSLKVIGSEELVGTICFTRPFFEKSFPIFNKFWAIALNAIRNLALYYYYVTNNKKLPRNAFFLAHISGMIFKRHKLEKVFFNVGAKASEDWEFVADALKYGDIYILPEFLVNYRYSVRSNTGSALVRVSRWRDYQGLLERLSDEYGKGFIQFLFRLYILLLKFLVSLRHLNIKAYYLSEYLTKVTRLVGYTRSLYLLIVSKQDMLVSLGRNRPKFVVNHYIDLMTLKEVFLDNDYKTRIKNPGIVVDIGANIGAFAIYSSLLGAGKIYCFEPVASTFQLLMTNLAINGINNVKSYKLGVAAKVGYSKIYVSKASGLSSLYKRGVQVSEEKIKLVTLGRIFSENNIKECDLLKMDCEGAEYDVLKSTPSSIFGLIKNIIIEFHEGYTGRKKEEVIETLKQNGYRIRIKPHAVESDIGLIYATRKNEEK